jgi:predicted O-methyltransferase YrrM
VDGYHSAEQARYDYEAFEGLLDADGITLLHDTLRCRISGIYGAERAYECRVKCFVDELKNDKRLQIFDLPFGQGVTLVRKLGGNDDDGLQATPSVSVAAAN